MTQPPAPHDGKPDPAASRDLMHDRRALALIGAGVVAVAAIGLFVVKPLLSGSSSSSTGVVASAHHHTATAAATASASPSVTPKPTAIATAAPALDVRDPFSPLVTPPSATSSATAAPSASPTASASTQVQTVVVQEPGPTVTASAKYTLVLTSLTTSKATVTLNGKNYSLSQRELFPGSSASTSPGPFQLSNISGTTAYFYYGANMFALVAGQTQYEN